jgi:hypothetical protein
MVITSSRNSGDKKRSSIFGFLNFSKRNNADKSQDDEGIEYMVSSALLYSEAIDHDDDLPSGRATPIFRSYSSDASEENQPGWESAVHSENSAPKPARSASSDSNGRVRARQYTPRTLITPIPEKPEGERFGLEDLDSPMSMSIISSPNQIVGRSFMKDDYQYGHMHVMHSHHSGFSPEADPSHRPTNYNINNNRGFIISPAPQPDLRLDLDRMTRQAHNTSGTSHGEALSPRACMFQSDEFMEDERSEDASPVVHWSRPHLQQFTPDDGEEGQGEENQQGGHGHGHQGGNNSELYDDRRHSTRHHSGVSSERDDMYTDVSEPMLTDRTEAMLTDRTERYYGSGATPRGVLVGGFFACVWVCVCVCVLFRLFV